MSRLISSFSFSFTKSEGLRYQLLSLIQCFLLNKVMDAIAPLLPFH